MIPGKRRGFTLIELMLVVAIIGLLAAVAIPKFGTMIRRSREASTLGKLGAVRSAVTIYYSDNEGDYPDQLYVLTIGGKYLDSMPVPWTYDHGGNPFLDTYSGP